MSKVKVGVIGCGNISGIYFSNGTKVFEDIEIAACADLIKERAEQAARDHNIPKACSPEELLADDEIEIVLNLTIPNVHAEVDLAALEAGKHVYAEKPLAVDREDGKKIMDVAKQKNLRVGSAPDTFLGGAFQTCRKLIDDGAIGEPVACTAFMMCHGHESWHPDPDFYYQPGGGPMFDMGPYYLTALISLLGPVTRISGSTRVTFPEREITSQPKYGTIIKVNTPTHIAGTMDFANGAVGTIVTSFDVWRHNLPCIEIHGREGSLMVPDPNGFGGSVKMWKPGDEGWKDVELTHGYTDNMRCIGVADMAKAIRTNRPHRANGDLALHVLDCMASFLDSSEQSKAVHLTTSVERPAMLPVGLEHGKLD